jgi:hypothetical protein
VRGTWLWVRGSADLLHASTAVALAAVSAPDRRAGRRSAALAVGLAVAQLLASSGHPVDDAERAGPATDNGLPEHLVLLRGGVMDGATVVVDRDAAEYSVTDAEHGLQRYLPSGRTARTIDGVSPVFVLDGS